MYTRARRHRRRAAAGSVGEAAARGNLGGAGRLVSSLDGLAGVPRLQAVRAGRVHAACGHALADAQNVEAALATVAAPLGAKLSGSLRVRLRPRHALRARLAILLDGLAVVARALLRRLEAHRHCRT